MRITGILLAAGSAQRFGAPKLIQPLADGMPVGVAAVRNLFQVLSDVVAVARPADSDLIAALSTTGVRVVENPRAAEGLGSSIAAGVAASPGADGWLIALADMPWVDPLTIRGLADGLRNGASIIAPFHRGTRGHPVGFAGHWADHLRSLQGDVGARGLISAHADQLQILKTDDAGVLADIDYPHDL